MSDDATDIRNPVDANRDELLSLIGPQIKIDGKRYAVKGVESFAIPHIRSGLPIGILTDKKIGPKDQPQ